MAVVKDRAAGFARCSCTHEARFKSSDSQSSQCLPHFLSPMTASSWLQAGLIFAMAWLAASRVIASDWPQYRGSNHDGVSDEVIRTNCAERPPRQLWKVPLGRALSSFAIAGGKVFTQVVRTVDGQEQEVCVALKADTGQEMWATALGIAQYDGGVGSDDGPRSTPSVAGDFAYV